MPSRSSLLQHLPFSGAERSTLLPRRDSPNSSIRKKPSEYDLAELSPRPADPIPPDMLPRDSTRVFDSKSPHFSARDSDKPGVYVAPGSKMKQRVLFAGPPPPIATSMLLYKDEEDGGTRTFRRRADNPGRNVSLTRSALNTVSSVLFDRRATSHPADYGPAFEPDTTWRSIQRREKAIQFELQHLLDVQSDGLAGHFGGGGPATASTTPHSTTASETGRGSSRHSEAGSHRSNSRDPNISPDRRRSSAVSSLPSDGGQMVIPVRQPRRRPMGLAAARTEIGRCMMRLAELKEEEDSLLASAVAARKDALVRLRKLAGQRRGIVKHLEALRDGDEDPVAREFGELEEELNSVEREMAQLEERLRALRQKKRQLDARVEDVRNRREAGLSGYKGALRDVDAKVSGLLTSPPVHPLDPEALSASRSRAGDDTAPDADGDFDDAVATGIEFMRLRPERRTVEMARDWWEGEVHILERRRSVVERERTALEEGMRVWNEAVRLVSDFEARLRKEMRGELEADDKGKQSTPTPEQAMYAQLDRMAEVMSGLERHLQTAEDHGWNLLICAIGAELEAFREADRLLRETLGAAAAAAAAADGSVDGKEEEDDDDGGPTPRLGRSANFKPVSGSRQAKAGGGKGSGDGGGTGELVDFAEEKKDSAESDNEVPPDLLAVHEEEEHDDTLPRGQRGGKALHHEGSEDEIPPEFLAQHDDGEDD
ncbi:hypothetical protein VTK73DRAFT_9614 [Phialemonium thermophilum]|uniref:Autophagy-related protein 28 n=1 Tax=Phialemonium thermophilum TaxID=223376 RepID=A0ABR3XKB4_9PEZI